HAVVAGEERLRHVERDDRDEPREERDEERDLAPERRGPHPEADPHDRDEREEDDEGDASELEAHCVFTRLRNHVMPRLTATIPATPTVMRSAFAMSWPRMEPRRTGSRER